MPNEEPHVGNKSFSTWQCKSDWCKKKVIIPSSTNSNLKTHLLTVKHKPEKEDFDKTAETTPKQACKRFRVEDQNEVASPLLQMCISNSMTPAKLKFNRNPIMTKTFGRLL